MPKLFFGYARDLAALYPFGVGGVGDRLSRASIAALFFDLIERYRPTVFVKVPTMMQAMLDHADAADRDLSSIRLCVSGGEALPQALRRRWNEQFGVEMLDGIGSSEAYHIYTSNRPAPSRPGSVGQIVPGYRRAWSAPTDLRCPMERSANCGYARRTAAVMYWGDAREVAADVCR